MRFRLVPWYNGLSIPYIESLLGKEKVMFEWGAGGSTLWYAARVAHIYTVEHAEAWAKMTQQRLQEDGLTNATVFHRTYPPVPNYTGVIKEIGKKFDIIAIDGRNRVACMKEALPYLKGGGYLILDDMQRPRYDESRELLSDWSQRKFGPPGKTTIVYQKEEERAV